MFNYRDEYIEATQYAQINTYEENPETNMKLVFLNLLLLSILIYLGFSYLKSEHNNVSLGFDGYHKTVVMGVSHDSPVYEYKDEKFIQLIHHENQELMVLGDSGKR